MTPKPWPVSFVIAATIVILATIAVPLILVHEGVDFETLIRGVTSLVAAGTALLAAWYAMKAKQTSNSTADTVQKIQVQTDGNITQILDQLKLANAETVSAQKDTATVIEASRKLATGEVT